MGADVMRLILDMGQGAIDILTAIFNVLSLDASTVWNNILSWLGNRVIGVDITEIVNNLLPAVDTPLWLFLEVLGSQPLWMLFFGTGLVLYFAYQFITWIANVVT